ncbi:hypothetical protein BJ165DRAFT_1436429 [Panaeolus papilionaceus]|nr:hypothetical protein BJ165DRAFT_1436429 [Panaeolus papilionaceus]
MSSSNHGNNTFIEEDYSLSFDPPKVPKRVQMACQFCRGRKLKCDGLKPSCANCHKRNYACSYTPVSQ